MPPYTDEDYEKLANDARELLGIGDIVRLDGKTILEAAKSRGVINDYEIVPDADLLGAGGCYDPTRRVIMVTQSV